MYKYLEASIGIIGNLFLRLIGIIGHFFLRFIVIIRNLFLRSKLDHELGTNV